MKNAIVVGGSNGIGLSIVAALRGYDNIYVVDRQRFTPPYDRRQTTDRQALANPNQTRYHFVPFDLLSEDYTLFDHMPAVDTLIITAGLGRLALFENTDEEEIQHTFQVNTIGPMRVIRHLYDRIRSQTEDFYCAVMVSISGMISSPFFSIYSASKAALHRFIESVNVELEKSGTRNRILEVSPGSIQGTRFYGGSNDLSQTGPLAEEILGRMYRHETLYIPQYEEIFKEVLERYRSDPRRFGLESYDYKVKSGRVK